VGVGSGSMAHSAPLAPPPPPAYPAPTRFRGRLIAVEGIDGSGKSTQVRLLLEWLQAAGVPAYLTAWNSSPLVHGALRRAKARHLLTPETFSLMHAADLADRWEREVQPRLRAGQVVLADRWVCTALARDGARGLSPEWIRRVYAFAPRPRLTVYFRLPVDVAVGRIVASRPQLKYYEAGLDLGLAADAPASFLLFQQRVSAAYESLVADEGLSVIDAQAAVGDQQAELRRLVRVALRGYRPTAGGRLWSGQAARPGEGVAARGAGSRSRAPG
jgi:dTMP kinase